MSLQFSIDNILAGKMEHSRGSADSAVSAQLSTASSMAPYMRASLSAAAAAAVTYPNSGLAACYSYLYPYVSSTPGLYPTSGECISYGWKFVFWN